VGHRENLFSEQQILKVASAAGATMLGARNEVSRAFVGRGAARFPARESHAHERPAEWYVRTAAGFAGWGADLREFFCISLKRNGELRHVTQLLGEHEIANRH
jgi:hypothetical protein